MNTARKTFALTAAASAVMALAGCGNSDQPVSIHTPSVQISLPPSNTSGSQTSANTPTSGSPSMGSSTATPATSAPTSSSIPASTPSMRSGSAQDATDAIALIKRWDAEMTKLYADPSQSVQNLTNYAVNEALSVSQTRILALRGRQQRVIGERQWVSNQVAQNTYDSRGHYMTIKSCLDVSKVTVVDKTGKNVTNRKQTRFLETYVLAKPNDSDWKISIIQNSGQPC